MRRQKSDDDDDDDGRSSTRTVLRSEGMHGPYDSLAAITTAVLQDMCLTQHTLLILSRYLLALRLHRCMESIMQCDVCVADDGRSAPLHGEPVPQGLCSWLLDAVECHGSRPILQAIHQFLNGMCIASIMSYQAALPQQRLYFWCVRGHMSFLPTLGLPASGHGCPSGPFLGS